MSAPAGTTRPPSAGRSARRPLPAHTRSLPLRVLGGIATPGGAVWVLALGLLIALIGVNPNFGEPSYLAGFLSRLAPLAIVALGQYFVIVSGEFDLSMGAVIALQVVIAGELIQDPDRIWPVTAFMLLLGVGVGVVNGLATTVLKVPSFIVTLGTMLAIIGIVDNATGGSNKQNPVDEYRDLGRGGFEDVPVVENLDYSVIALLVLCVLAAWVMHRPFGRSLLAVGDNPDASRFAGSSPVWLKTRAFVLSSLAATVAGMILVGQVGVNGDVGEGYEFYAITAVVLGGVVLGGGRGWVLSAVGGTIALELLITLLNAMEVIETTWRDTVQGVIIIVAVAVSGRAWGIHGRPGRRSPAVDEPTPAPAEPASP
jgi:ribose transport system permease protein